MNFEAVKAWQAQRNIGMVMAPLLVAAGIEVADLHSQSVEDIFLKFWSYHQNPRYLNANYLYALHGAKHDCDWLDLSAAQKAKYRQFLSDLKASWQR